MFSFYLISLHYFLFNHLENQLSSYFLSHFSPSLCILISSIFIWLFNSRQFIISFTLYTSILIFQSNLILSAIFTLLLLRPLSLFLSLFLLFFVFVSIFIIFHFCYFSLKLVSFFLFIFVKRYYGPVSVGLLRGRVVCKVPFLEPIPSNPYYPLNTDGTGEANVQN